MKGRGQRSERDWRNGVSFFLTGTDTGVGKTYTAIRILRLARAAGMRCAGMKPICCGDRRDAELLLAESTEGLTIDELNPVWLKSPLAPLPASLIEKVEINIDRFLDGLKNLRARFDLVVVEGVGGWLVPIRRDYFVADLALEMNLPVVVVAQNRLGCLNHAMLTVRGVTGHGLVCAGVALNLPARVNDIASSTNADILAQITQVPVLPMLTDEMTEFPPGWHRVIELSRRPRPGIEMSPVRTLV